MAIWKKVWGVQTLEPAVDGELAVVRSDGEIKTVKVGEPIRVTKTKTGKSLYLYIPLDNEPQG
jgi:hypothetical protein